MSNIVKFPAKSLVPDEVLSQYIEQFLDPNRFADKPTEITDEQLVSELVERKALSPTFAKAAMKSLKLRARLVESFLKLLDGSGFTCDVFGRYGVDEGWGMMPVVCLNWWSSTNKSVDIEDVYSIELRGFVFDELPTLEAFSESRQDARQKVEWVVPTPEASECPGVYKVVKSLLELAYAVGNGITVEDSTYGTKSIEVIYPNLRTDGMFVAETIVFVPPIEVITHDQSASSKSDVSELGFVKSGLSNDEFTQRQLETAVESVDCNAFVDLLEKSIKAQREA